MSLMNVRYSFLKVIHHWGIISWQRLYVSSYSCQVIDSKQSWALWEDDRKKEKKKKKKKNLAETETQPHLKALCVGLLVIADFHNERECRRQKGFSWKSAVGGSHCVWYEEVGLISDLLKSGQLRWRWRLHALHRHSGTCKCTADSEGHF